MDDFRSTDNSFLATNIQLIYFQKQQQEVFCEKRCS